MKKITHNDFAVCIAGAVLSFFAASVVFAGWSGISPILSHPFFYSNDGISHSWMIQRVIEGWVFENPRNGYPFGSDFYDYPSSDAGNFFALKLLGLMGGSFYSAYNLYVLVTFPLCFVSFYALARALSIGSLWAFVFGLAFAFSSFHFARLNHLFYLAYFVAPFFFYFAIQFSRPDAVFSASRLLFIFLLFIVFSSFGVYFALFGLILLSVSFFYRWMNYGTRPIPLGMTAAVLGILVGVFINYSPTLMYRLEHGQNPEAVVRDLAGAEIYGLKLTTMVLPHANHQVAAAAHVSRTYAAATPLNNENVTASLGVLGAVGLLAALVVLMRRPTPTGLIDQRQTQEWLHFVAVCILVLFLFGTIGGLGSLFAMTVSSSIRGWNRVSVFIHCGVLLILACHIGYWIKNIKNRSIGNALAVVASLSILAWIFVDQVPAGRPEQTRKIENVFNQDKQFYSELGNLVGEGAVYQLPYIPFPEPPHSVAAPGKSYAQALGFLHTQSVKWSYGGMKGRPGDMFYRHLAKAPLAEQVKVVQTLGFSGIFLNAQNFPDGRRDWVKEVGEILNMRPTLTHPDGSAFFKFNTPAFDVSDKSFEEIVALAYSQQDLSWSDSERLDFSREYWPMVAWLEGAPRADAAGRWSSGRKVQLQFKRPLPQRFELKLKARGLRKGDEGPQVTMHVGDKAFLLDLTNSFKEFSFEVEAIDVSAISFEVDKPMSPQQLGINADKRMLGIALSSMEIRPVP